MGLSLDKGRIEALALELFNAERLRKAVPSITEREPSLGVDDAYAVQMVNINKVVSMGHVISGKKIGLTSLAMQRQLGVGEPDYGHLFAAMDCPGGRVDTGALIQPKIEAELAFVLKHDLLGGNVTTDDVDDATDYITAAFEIVDSRIADWRIKLPDTVADNASSGRYILGSKKVMISDVDLPSVEMKLYKRVDASGSGSGCGSGGGSRCNRNGSSGGESGGGGIDSGINNNISTTDSDKNFREELIGEGLGSAVMGDPRVSVAWLANKLWGYGVALRAGEIVLSGALSAAPAAQKGDVFRAEFTGVGIVEARFE